MTLCTHVLIREPVDAMTVFAKCRDLLGATEKTEARLYFHNTGNWLVGNKIAQGLPALLDIEFRPGAPLRTPEQSAEHEDWCNDDCDGSHHEPPCWLDVSFDTAYGYQSSDGEGCGHVHVRLVSDLGLWLNDRGLSWQWQNEYTGEWHDGSEGFEPLTELIGGSEAAHEWFTNLVLPAIVASQR